MKLKYRLLVTKRSLDALLTTPESERTRVSSFLDFLMQGGWEEDAHGFPDVHAWKPSGEERFIFSCFVSEGLYAIWEVLWTTDLASRLNVPEYGDREAPHNLSLHILLYSIGDFPGEPGTVMHLLNEDFSVVGPVEKSHLGFHEREPKDEVRYNEELFILAQTRIPDVLKGDQRGLPLHLTIEQADVLSTHRTVRGPILMSGEAGSGKTSVITHWLMINRLEGVQPQLFVTFSPRLIERAETEFGHMMPPHLEPQGVRFLTYRELLWEIANIGGLSLRDQSREMTFERFLREYARRIPPQIDPVLLWDEIRSVIKGGCLDITKRMIDLSTYEDLSERRGRCKTPKEMRNDYYDETQRYQNYLDRNGLWDSVDLAADCMRKVDQSKKYKCVACDEVQDLAPIEICVLIELVEDRNIDNIFFTGDMAQVINPSGFSWARLKGFLGEESKRRDIRDAWSLGQNFRSTTEIVELVNEVIRIREGILADASGRNIQDSDVSSDVKPMILKASPIEQLKEATSNPQQRLVLVKTREQKELIKETLGESWENTTILTVEESKGLEWDGVLLWNFFIPRHEVITKNDWEEIFIPQKRQTLQKLIEQGKKNPYGLAYEFNLLHVGLTRARKVLFIYDEDSSHSVKALGESIEDLVKDTDINVFSATWETTLPSPEQLEILALDLLEKDMDQAYRFFRLAAREYEKKDKLEEAAKCFSRVSDFGLAASCYEKAGNECEKERMLALDHEKGDQWEEAGKHWKTHSDIAQESGTWRTAYDGYGCAAGAFVKAAGGPVSIDEKEEMFTAAAEMYEYRSQSISQVSDIRYAVRKAESLYRAADYWTKADSPDKAQQDWESAIEVARPISKNEETVSIGGEMPDAWIANCLTRMADAEEKAERHLDAARLALEAGTSFRKASEKAKLDSEKETHLDNQQRWVQLAAKWYYEGGEIKEAIKTQRGLKDLREKERNKPRLTESWEGLVCLYRDSGLDDEFIGETRRLVDYLRGNGDKDKGYEVLDSQIDWCKENESPESLVKLLERKEQHCRTDEDFNKAGRTLDTMGELRLEAGGGREAISAFLEAGRNYLKQYSNALALKSFERALEVAGSEFTPSSIGWTSFREIVIDSLVPDRLDDLAKPWIETAVGHFVQEYKQSVSRVTGYAEILEEKLERVNEDLLAEGNEDRRSILQERKTGLLNMNGWTLLCLGRLYQEGRQEGVAPVGHRQSMVDSYSSSLEQFNEAKNDPMSSYVKDLGKKAS